jgi:hypothetical protein
MRLKSLSGSGRALLLAMAIGWIGLPSGRPVSALAQADRPTALDDVIALMARAHAEGRVGTARKTRLVDARNAKAGEVIVTIIKGEGKETTSRPAKQGDWVVRNRCPQTGNEEYLVGADKFADRYRPAGSAMTQDGWQAFVPQGKTLRFLVLTSSEAPFTFVAPWGEPMIARPGDPMVQDPENERDVYRVAKASFECTYEVVVPPTRPGA